MMDKERIAKAVRTIMEEAGIDLTDDDVRETPERVARFWEEFIEYDPGNTDTMFDGQFAVGDIVALKDVTVWSLCAHHLLPFKARVSIAYRITGNMIGLSKLARIAWKHARKLQTQERMARGIMNEVRDITGAEEVIVIIDGWHTCMQMRGIRSDGTMRTIARTTFCTINIGDLFDR